jgi:hypothetical protein
MSARFEFESDLSIDPETKERIRCKRMIPFLPTAPNIQRLTLAASANCFDEQISLDSALLQRPAFTHLGILFQVLRNKQNHVRSFTADGFVLSIPAQQDDFI